MARTCGLRSRPSLGSRTLAVSCMSWINSMITRWLMSAPWLSRLMRYNHLPRNLRTSLVCYWNKFVVGGIIAKLPPSWRNFATSLKHKRQEFSVSNLIGSLDVEEKARAKDKSAGGAEGGSSANLVQKKNFQSYKSKNKGKPDDKGKFDAKNKASRSTNFKKKTDRRKVLAMSAVVLITGLLAAPTAMTSASMGKAARPLMLSLVILR